MGERAEDRQAIDNITRDILAQPYKPGKRPSPEQAQQMARNAMTEADRRLREQGKR
jgi:hypothetical protein